MFNAKNLLVGLSILFAVLSYYPGLPTLGLAVILLGVANLI